MAHHKTERWTCDAPDCGAAVTDDPCTIFSVIGRGPQWRYVQGLYVCPRHRIDILVDGQPVKKLAVSKVAP